MNYPGGYLVCYDCLKQDVKWLCYLEENLSDKVLQAYPRYDFWKSPKSYFNYRKQFYVSGYPSLYLGGQYDAYFTVVDGRSKKRKISAPAEDLD